VNRILVSTELMQRYSDYVSHELSAGNRQPYLFPEKDLNPIDPERIRAAFNKLQKILVKLETKN